MGEKLITLTAEQRSSLTSSTPRRSGVDRRMAQRTEAAACMSVVAALRHIQIEPSSGRAPLYLHATAGGGSRSRRSHSPAHQVSDSCSCHTPPELRTRTKRDFNICCDSLRCSGGALQWNHLGHQLHAAAHHSEPHFPVRSTDNLFILFLGTLRCFLSCNATGPKFSFKAPTNGSRCLSGGWCVIAQRLARFSFATFWSMSTEVVFISAINRKECASTFCIFCSVLRFSLLVQPVH